MRSAGTAILLALSGGLAACSADTSPGTEDAGVLSCEGDPRAETYTANLAKTSAEGSFTVTLSSSDPAPPAKGDNVWQIELTSDAGEPISDAPLVFDAFMPEHGHGTSIKPTITPGADGTYEIAPVNLFMPGLWRITISGAAAGSPADAVEFFFCISG